MRWWHLCYLFMPFLQCVLLRWFYKCAVNSSRKTFMNPNYYTSVLFVCFNPFEINEAAWCLALIMPSQQQQLFLCCSNTTWTNHSQTYLRYTVMLKWVVMIIYIYISFFRHTAKASVNCHIQFGTNQIFHYAVTWVRK